MPETTDIKYEIYADIDRILVNPRENTEEVVSSVKDKRIGVYYDSMIRNKENNTTRYVPARSKAYADRSGIMFKKVRKQNKVIAGEQNTLDNEEENAEYINVASNGVVAWNSDMPDGAYMKERFNNVKVRENVTNDTDD